MAICSVLGCQSRSLSSSSGKRRHFFRFPKSNLVNNRTRELWIKFTKRKNFVVKEGSSAICENHFSPECFTVKKKGRLCLVKDSVPTLYVREFKDKIERFEIPYDRNAQEYIIDESFNLHIHLDTIEREKKLLKDRDQKVLEIKNACRYCLEKEQDIKCVAITKLEAYSIDAKDILIMLGINESQYSELLSDVVCEKCFQIIVEIDSYRKRCQKAQSEFVEEIQEVDQQIEEIRSCMEEQKSFFNVEVLNEIAGQEEVEECMDDEAIDQSYDLIEEHLENYDETYDQSYLEYQIEGIKHDEDEEMIEESSMNAEEFVIEGDKFLASDKVEEVFDDKERYDIANKDEIIKNPDRNTCAYRIYECFFCRLKFEGRKTFKAHDCQVKEIKCEVEGCDKKFTKQSGYNQHIVKIHQFLKVTKHFCPICKQVIIASETQFKQHFKKCNKEFCSKEQNIECEICKKQCKNLKSYTVHKMFHDSRKLVKARDSADDNSEFLSTTKSKICELCGRTFTNNQGLRTHKKNVHLIGSNGEIYQCDICNKHRPTKRSLFNHMRNVHRVQKTPCTVCGKVFRTKALLQKHMMYHDETKRIHFCDHCPEHPGYFTNVALRRHQKSHHIGMKEFVCNFESCECSYTSNHMLLLHQRKQHGAIN